MKKVYLITFHGSVNYGAVLQAYALYRKISELGYDVEVIDYNRKTHHRNYLKVSFARNPIHMVAQMAKLPGKMVLHRKFNRFTMERMALSAVSYNGREALQTFTGEKGAVYFVGSDQVWNCGLTENDFHYFLDFVSSPFKYSYGSSFGVADVSGWAVRDRIKELLQQFRKISVREETGADIVEQLIERRPSVVCDPTFLIDGSQWREIAVPPERKGYVLLFMLASDPQLIEAARAVAAARGLDAVQITYWTDKLPGFINVGNLSPEEWLGYFANAEYVFTNSFHGFALSLNMNRQVWVKLSQNGRNSRIVDLARRYGVQDRLISESTVRETEIDYTAVNALMQADRAASIRYLEDCLNDGDKQNQ